MKTDIKLFEIDNQRVNEQTQLQGEMCLSLSSAFPPPPEHYASSSSSISPPSPAFVFLVSLVDLFS